MSVIGKDACEPAWSYICVFCEVPNCEEASVLPVIERKTIDCEI